MTSRWAARTLPAAALVLVALLVWNATRSPGVDRPVELTGLSESGLSEAPPASSLIGPHEESAARESVAGPSEALEGEEPRPRLVVAVTSEGTNSPARPLPDATVRAEGFDLPLGSTDGAGRLEFDLPAGTEGVRLRAEAPGHARASTTAYVEGGVARAELTLSQVAVLVGRVRHADGTPAADARVAAFGEEESRDLEAPEGPRRQGPGTPDTLTDEQGRYSLEVSAGSWRLASTTAYGTGRLWGWTGPVEAVEGAETRVDDLVLPVVPWSRILRGRVLDARRAPVAEARVSYKLDTTKKMTSRGSTPVDAEGYFAIVGEEGDAYELIAGANAPGLAQAGSRGIVGGPEVELVLESAPLLEVTVLTADGPPERELRWWLGRLDEVGDPTPIRYGTSPAEVRGAFLATWPEGAEVLEIMGFEGHPNERVKLPPRPPPGERDRVEVRMREGLRLEGRILGAARGLALPLVRARRVTEGELSGDPAAWPRRGTPATRMNEDGSFLLGLAEPGSYMIGVTGALRAPRVLGPYEVIAPPGVLDLEIELSRPAAPAEDE